MAHQLFLQDELGNIRFTSKGINELTSYFAQAGIDIRCINTVDEYYLAREAAAPYFENWLEEKASEWPDTDQYRLLRTAVFDNSEALDKELHRFSVKQTLTVIN